MSLLPGRGVPLQQLPHGYHVRADADHVYVVYGAEEIVVRYDRAVTVRQVESDVAAHATERARIAPAIARLVCNDPAR